MWAPLDWNLNHGMIWKNGLVPYIKNKGIWGCPSNPSTKGTAGNKTTGAANGQGEGWFVEQDSLMPISYGMNSTITSWVPANWVHEFGMDTWSPPVTVDPLTDAK